MAEHKLEFGLRIIDKLFRLGEILWYHSEKEYPVDKDNKSAVDVAWLYEVGQKYPLFIFEIESATTNSIVANPSKIFGESNQKFEKPLFLLLLKGGDWSGKISQLENLFGSHNYRIYRFSLDEELNLILDILTQHRRLTNSLNIFELISELLDNWKLLDINKILLHIEDLGFEKDKGTILPSYALLTRKYSAIKPHFIRLLKLKIEKPKGLFEGESYDTYLGNEWEIPIHLGILSAFADDKLEDKYFDDFMNWQEKSYYIKQIGANYGLSRDYDLFILGMAGAVLGITAVLFYKVDKAREYIAGELFDIIKNSDGFNPNTNIFNALWLLHIAPDTGKGKEYYEYAKEYINSNGGIPEKIYTTPQTNYIGFLEGDDNLEDYGKRTNVVSWTDFKENKSSQKFNADIVFDLAINYLTDNEDKWNPITNGQL
ncbi:hypothetical protein [Pedobacter jejuensis]|nr:hypothetical protein [Pedobacter jejuensis]